LDYTLRQTNNGVYLFIIAGTVSVSQQKLNKRDGAAITQTGKFSVQANTPADLLLIEVPLTY
jgi:redox-sensitive bicupin YhaK (pirin superfamily)